MMKTCKKCGKEFLTEADPYAVIPAYDGVEYNCGCYFVNNKLLTISAMAMQGILSSENIECQMMSPDKIARYSVQQAKALIDALNEGESKCE